GDIVPARQRGKYQGIMGSVFGISSIAAPLIGGMIADSLGWRWLFFVNLPFGVLAMAFIVRFMHLPHQPRPVRLNVFGFATLAVGLTAVLLATSMGGNLSPW